MGAVAGAGAVGSRPADAELPDRIWRRERSPRRSGRAGAAHRRCDDETSMRAERDRDEERCGHREHGDAQHDERDRAVLVAGRGARPGREGAGLLRGSGGRLVVGARRGRVVRLSGRGRLGGCGRRVMSAGHTVHREEPEQDGEQRQDAHDVRAVPVLCRSVHAAKSRSAALARQVGPLQLPVRAASRDAAAVPVAFMNAPPCQSSRSTTVRDRSTRARRQWSRSGSGKPCESR